MTTESTVLIVSTVADIATDHVVKGLAAKGCPHRRLNTEDLPFSQTLAFDVDDQFGSSLSLDGERLLPPTAVWYRRVRVPGCPPEMDEGVYDFCLHETRAALLGSLVSCESRWMSHPAKVWQAELKANQLHVARQLGLHVPRTVVTNDPRRIQQAFDAWGPMVVKACRSGYAVVDGQPRSIYTSRLLVEHLDYLDEARLSPSIYQALIPKRWDIRATIVGRRIFAAAIESQTDPAAVVDWRRTENPNLPHRPVELPAAVQSRLLKVMDTLGLTFGAIDLVQTPEDDFVFLEVNPNGQWLWIDDQLGLGITNAIVDWLSCA